LGLCSVEAKPHLIIPELAAKLEAEKAVPAHPASRSRVLLKAGLSFKKHCCQRGRAREHALGAGSLASAARSLTSEAD